MNEKSATMDGAEQELELLVADILEAEDEERRRMARELHDTTAQHLAAVLISIDHLIASRKDRMMPVVRFFRHSDGSFARFNGMGPTPADLLFTLLAYD